MTFKLDSSAVRLAIARRLARETTPTEKLAILQRLQRRYIECNLPRESETRVEQSFNEQLFARVLDYRTLLSHDSLPYHVRPKNFARGSRRFDDFSLGTFWGDDRDVVLASAEFKDPGSDLDAAQTDRSERISPVVQAFRAARGFSTCKWVIVSNFREVRLYHVDQESEPLAVFDLHEVRTPRQLAVLAAHLDFDALLGTEGKSGMTTSLDPNHLGAPLPAAANAFRLVCTFTPSRLHGTFRLSPLYDALREAAVEHMDVKRDQFDRTPLVPTKIEDGWVSVETPEARLAMSNEGQVRYTLRHPRTSGPAQINPDAGFWSIATAVHRFLLIVNGFYRALIPPGQQRVYGPLGFELREIRGWQVGFSGQSELLKKDDSTNSGVAETDEIFSGDVMWDVGSSPSYSAGVAADCTAELALQFRSHAGARVRFDNGAAAKLLEADAKARQPARSSSS